MQRVVAVSFRISPNDHSSSLVRPHVTRTPRYPRFAHAPHYRPEHFNGLKYLVFAIFLIVTICGCFGYDKTVGRMNIDILASNTNCKEITFWVLRNPPLITISEHPR